MGDKIEAIDDEMFDVFIQQLQNFVRDRLVPAEDRLTENSALPNDVLAERRNMGLFGLTVPTEFGGSNFWTPSNLICDLVSSGRDFSDLNNEAIADFDE